MCIPFRVLIDDALVEAQVKRMDHKVCALFNVVYVSLKVSQIGDREKNKVQ